MKKKGLFLLVFLILGAQASLADEPPEGNLSFDYSIIYAGNQVTIFIEASDDVAVKEIYASYDGSWHRFDCAANSGYCTHNWTWKPTTAGTYEIGGYIRDSADNGVATVPDKIYLTVISASTTSTASGTSTTTNPVITTSSPLPSTTTSQSTPSNMSSTTTTLSRNYLEVIGNFINYTVCTLLQSIWVIAAGLSALIIMAAGLRYMSSNEPESRNQARKSIINVFATLIVIFLAVPVINYFVTGTPITPLTCNLTAGPPITYLNPTNTTRPPTTTLPENICVIKGVYIERVLFSCGSQDSLCPQQFNPTAGGCPPGSKTMCNPQDPDC